MLLGRYLTIHKYIILHTDWRVSTHKNVLCVGDPILNKDKNISQYISECKLHLMNYFFIVRINLMFTS